MATRTQDAPASPDFDLDSWIDDARLPEKAETVYGRADLVAEHQSLEKQLQQAQRDSLNDDRIVNPADELAARLRDVEERMQASALTFRFRALTGPEAKEVRNSVPKDDDGEPENDPLVAAWLAASCVSPANVTPEQMLKIRGRIGEGQYALLWSAAFSVSNDRRVDVPFSLAASVALKTKDS